jgi:SAM-dependent methyltransferase
LQTEGFRVTNLFEGEHWWFRSRREVILRQVERACTELGFPEKRLKLLDFGCGTGYNLKYFSAFGDISGADRFRPEDEQYRLEHKFPLLDAEVDLEPLQGQFNLVTALDVIEHLDDDVEGLLGLRRLLAPGGQILLTVPAYEWLWSGEDDISEHRRRYTKGSLLRACKAAGLGAKYASYFNFSVLPAITSVIWSRRLFTKASEGPQSDLSMPPSWLNTALYRLTALEANWVGTERIAMPAGASIICRLSGES